MKLDGRSIQITACQKRKGRGRSSPEVPFQVRPGQAVSGKLRQGQGWARQVIRRIRQTWVAWRPYLLFSDFPGMGLQHS